MDSIKVRLHKVDIINLICGTPARFSKRHTCVKFTGNQWNDDWEWDRNALSKLGVDELAKMYFGDNFEEATGG